MPRTRGRSAEPRLKGNDVPQFVESTPTRDSASMERYGYGATPSDFTSVTDDETSLLSSGSARKRFKKMFKKKKKKKKKGRNSRMDGGGSISSESGLKRLNSFRLQHGSFGEMDLLGQRKKVNSKDRFRVMPDDAYPNAYMNRDELRLEMNQKSAYYHDLRVPYRKGKEIGQLRLEVLQCFGLPSASMVREVSAYAIAVCGSHAFKTDVIPSSSIPMWLSQMRRACMFPIFHAYDKIYLGIFDNCKPEGNSASDFIGRVVVDVSRLRAGCTYDITLPLRQSAHVFTRNQQGAVRVRMHMIWVSERSAVLSYLPRGKPKFLPDEGNKINCLDEKSFRDVAYLVHGRHLPGKFCMVALKATMREMNFNRIHIFRYIRRREIYNLRFWVYPFVSSFVFFSWMHSVYANTARYVPGHILTYFLLLLYVNYAHYGMDSPLQNGFLAPTIEELFNSLLYGTKGRRKKYIKALNMETDESNRIDPEDHMEVDSGDGVRATYDPADAKLSDIAEEMRRTIKVQNHMYRFKSYKNTFLGNEAVDFLIDHGYAYSRSDAVVLGCRLAEELRIFEHVAQEHRFEDGPLFYRFLDFDDKKYAIKGHVPKFKGIFKTLGLSKRKLSAKEDHLEFPFADGKSHPRFTVKQSIRLRSSEAKKMMKERDEAHEIVDCAEFGVVPAFAAEEEEHHAPDILRPGELVRTGIRRGSTVASATFNAAANFQHNIMNLPQNITARRKTMEFGDPDELIASLKQRNNPALDELLERRRMNGSLYDPYAYDSDDDVENISKRRKKGTIIEEKFLAKPPNQDFTRDYATGHTDKPFGKTMISIRQKAHGMVGHIFNDRVYKIDQALFPTKPPESNQDSGSVTAKRGLFGRISNDNSDTERDKKKKRNTRNPYDARMDEYDKILQINKYSHSNPWINRVAVIVQPMVEIVQLALFISRAGYNLMTWQDPILSFWIAIVGPVVVLMLHLTPYRVLFGSLGIYLFGPQNWLYRLFEESKAGYQPPNFDKIVKLKPLHNNEPYSEIQLFSSMTPGNQHIKFKNVDPRQVKQVIVPNSVLKYNRFYDWPPETEYARVWASPPPKNLKIKQRSAREFQVNSRDTRMQSDESDGDDEGQESSQSYWYDATLARTKQKKKKKGLKKVGHHVKKGAGVVVGTTVEAGGALTGAVVGVTGAVVGTTLGATIGVAKVTGKVAKGAVLGTAKLTAGAVDGAKNATSNLGEGLRKSASRAASVSKTTGFGNDDFSEFDDEGYSDYYD